MSVDSKKQTLIETLDKWVTDKESNGIKQHSDEWLKVRQNVIGGSSMSTIQGTNRYCNIIELLNQRVGISQFKTSIAPQWGNLFEDVIKRYVEKDMDCSVKGEDLYVLGRSGTSYSPDGLAVITYDDYDYAEDENADGTITLREVVNKKTEIALMEFKCPFNRIPNGRVPDCYGPQVKMGLDLLNLPTVGVYAEAVFRRCTMEQLGTTLEFNRNMNQKPSGKVVLAWGVIGMRFATPEGDNELLDEIQSEFADSDSVDFGAASSELFTKIMAAYDKKILAPIYQPIIYPGEELVEEHIRACNEESAIGVIPWKLFRIDYHYIQPEKGYLNHWMPKINEIVDVITRCNNETDEKKKASVLQEYIESVSTEERFSDE